MTALAVSATLGWPVLLVLAGGMAVSAAYSLRPVRLADRGAVASLVLPACYAAVPYLTGALAARVPLRPAGLLLLAGLYLGFIGRILLKDFRDVRGDALFGKRTFLVRHGRRATCGLSACCWLAGTVVMLAAVPRLTVVLAGAETAGLAGALALLRALSRARGARRDEFLISAIAIIGRGMMLALLTHLSMLSAGWPVRRYDAVLAALCLLIAGQATQMARRGPAVRPASPEASVPASADLPICGH